MTAISDLRKVAVRIDGEETDFLLARQIGELIARRGNEDTTLVAWNDNLRNVHSPQCLHCEIKGEPGWEVYGRNHGGRLRITVNDGAMVLIYS
jgi:hypothetical protein